MLLIAHSMHWGRIVQGSRLWLILRTSKKNCVKSWRITKGTSTCRNLHSSWLLNQLNKTILNINQFILDLALQIIRCCSVSISLWVFPFATSTLLKIVNILLQFWVFFVPANQTSSDKLLWISWCPTVLCLFLIFPEHVKPQALFWEPHTFAMF